MKKILIVAVMTLTGCAVGIRDDGSSPQLSYEINHPYQTAYDRAVDQAQMCLLGNSSFEVHHHEASPGQQATIWVSDPLTGAVVVRTHIQALSATRSAVTNVVWGKGSWQPTTLNAMRQSMTMDASICTVYSVE